MAKQWEDSLIIALRDTQWERAVAKASFPPWYLKMDGNAESALGDLLSQNDKGHFFLFEVKASREDIKSEWVSNGGFRPKRLYAKLKSTIEAFMDDPTSDEGKAYYQYLIQSIRCHHFVYWGDPIATEPVSTNRTYDSLRVESYLRGVIDMSAAHAPTATQTIDASLSVEMGYASEDVGFVKPDIPYMILASGTGFVAVTHKDEKISPPYELGLPFFEFQDYVNFLTEDVGDWDEELHAVVHIPELGVIRVVTRTSELKSLVNPRKTTLRSQPRVERPMDKLRFFTIDVPSQRGLYRPSKP